MARAGLKSGGRPWRRAGHPDARIRQAARSGRLQARPLCDRMAHSFKGRKNTSRIATCCDKIARSAVDSATIRFWRFRQSMWPQSLFDSNDIMFIIRFLILGGVCSVRLQASTRADEPTAKKQPFGPFRRPLVGQMFTIGPLIWLMLLYFNALRSRPIFSLSPSNQWSKATVILDLPD